MESCDFGRSFITFVTEGRGNNARIQVEARCLVTDTKACETEEYFLVASCKSEDTYGKGVLFYEENYDFCVIFSQKENRIFRIGFPYDPTKSTIHTNEERFEEVSFHITKAEAEVLGSNQEIVRATLAGDIINGRTEISSADGRYRALIEFPVKTMNVNDIENLYQTDTGPILLPDFGMETNRMIERFQLAFVAYNRSDEAYFIIQEPAPASPGKPDGPQVCDYSRIVRLKARNVVLALCKE
ncbi:MAG: hypothetical protein GXP25_23915 [Planctomycetes bacterium]|nr:hypothetical protein [Planctomycetota bacterium]